SGQAKLLEVSCNKSGSHFLATGSGLAPFKRIGSQDRKIFFQIGDRDKVAILFSNRVLRK
ncbi:MAG TPA: hypothetical protein VGD31_09415, partial [Sphingobacteriaceae bacterium]